jgi:hypothetical protein
LAIEVLGHEPELDDEVTGEVLRLGLAALFLPEAQETEGLDSILMKCEGRLALVSQRNQRRAASPSSISPGPAGF